MAQKGTIKVNTESGVVALPVYDTSDFSESPIIRVQTETGIGALNLVDSSNSNASPVMVETQSKGIQAIATVGPSSTLTVTATLNSQEAEVTVFEDKTGDGTADNTETVAVQDGTNTYTVSNIDGGSGNDYWLNIELTNPSDITKTAEITDAELQV